VEAVRLIVAPSDHGWELKGDGDRVEAFDTLADAETAARILARELVRGGRAASVWRRELDGRLVETPSFADDR
jgi:hypothetical protein